MPTNFPPWILVSGIGSLIIDLVELDPFSTCFFQVDEICFFNTINISDHLICLSHITNYNLWVTIWIYMYIICSILQWVVKPNMQCGLPWKACDRRQQIISHSMKNNGYSGRHIHNVALKGFVMAHQSKKISHIEHEDLGFQTGSDFYNGEKIGGSYWCLITFWVKIIMFRANEHIIKSQLQYLMDCKTDIYSED